MTKEKLEQGNILDYEIKDREEKIQIAQTAKCESIRFAACGEVITDVCRDEKIIEKVRKLIIKEHQAALRVLNEQFKQL